MAFLARLKVWLGLRQRKLDIPALKKRYPHFEFGRGTYGKPAIMEWGEPATLRIGAFCSIAADVTIFLGGEHRLDWVTTFPFNYFRPAARAIAGHPHTKGDVAIGNDVWLAHGATILSGVTIGNGAVIGAHAVVSRDVPAYGIVAGNPARLVRKRFAEEVIRELEVVAWWDWADEEIDAALPLLLSADVERFIDYARQRFPATRRHPA
jgi:acetyltransferase-like isoleucine patch superfamily enzyme